MRVCVSNVCGGGEGILNVCVCVQSVCVCVWGGVLIVLCVRARTLTHNPKGGRKS